VESTFVTETVELSRARPSCLSSKHRNKHGRRELFLWQETVWMYPGHRNLACGWTWLDCIRVQTSLVERSQVQQQISARQSWGKAWRFPVDLDDGSPNLGSSLGANIPPLMCRGAMGSAAGWGRPSKGRKEIESWSTIGPVVHSKQNLTCFAGGLRQKRCQSRDWVAPLTWRPATSRTRVGLVVVGYARAAHRA